MIDEYDWMGDKEREDTLRKQSQQIKSLIQSKEEWRSLAVALADICLHFLKKKEHADRKAIKQIAESIKEMEAIDE